MYRGCSKKKKKKKLCSGILPGLSKKIPNPQGCKSPALPADISAEGRSCLQQYKTNQLNPLQKSRQ